MLTPDKAAAFDLAMLQDPGIRAEVERYEPIVRKLTDTSLLAIGLAYRLEAHRRVEARTPPRRVGIGNR